MPIALYRLPVSKGAKLVLSYLWRYAGREPFVWVDRETVASDLGIDNDRTMRRLLGELRTAGAIEEDEQVRQGRVRRGWWLWDGRDVGEDDVGGEVGEERDCEGEAKDDGDSVHGGALEQDDDCQTLEVDEDRGHEEARPSSADRNGRGRTKMAARAAKNDRGRTEMATAADKNDRATSLELPMNQSSLSDRAGASRSPPAEVDEGKRVRAELKLLRRWRVHGGDPEGLGAWPTPTTPGGVELPRLSMGGKLVERLQEEQTAEEIHRAVHLVAELVEAGELAPDKWRATYVFSGWLDELVVKAVGLRGKREREADRRSAEEQLDDRGDVEKRRFLPEQMLDTIAEAKAFQTWAEGKRRNHAIEKGNRRDQRRELERDLLNLRIEVQGVAEQFGWKPETVLQALGRVAMRDLEAGDRDRLKELAIAWSRVADQDSPGHG